MYYPIGSIGQKTKKRKRKRKRKNDQKLFYSVLDMVCYCPVGWRVMIDGGHHQNKGCGI